ncbi:hypothetical protein LAZ67_5002220 [Cordylochernes scorpioides]|uniref:RNA-directed DNA polymerase n=1 Tax=Cordylochernes scorpioides TaxID=51811 RepID=A0ABY6KG92_9ARAC|nr:hypothetical protein LAZ67_5002220 [Cordylochernes scorpioides]
MHEGYLVSKNSGGIWVKVVPSDIREMVIKYHHDVPTGGHFGVKKVMRRLKDDYYWPGMRTQVRNYIYRCEGCQLSNQGVTKAGNAPHFRPGKPFEHLALDFIGPLEKTSKGHSSILTIVDLFTKFPILIPTRDQCASTVVKALLESVITIFGVPKTILSDRGSAFISCIFKGICKAMGVSAVNTTAWRPQSNGAVERLNRTVIESLRRCEAGSNWDDILPMVALAIRTTEHSSTGFTPAKLVFGHELRLPQPFQEAGQSPVSEDLIAQTAAFYERELTEEVEKIREVVRQTYLNEQEEARIKFENKGLRTFNNGDLVLVERMHETKGRHKFEPRYGGPYECGNPITHPLPRLPSTFHIGFTTEPVKVDRMNEDGNMQRMTEAEDEYFADALTNMQPHCDELVSRLTDAIRGIAVPRVEEALISPFDGSYAANNFIQQLERTSEGPQDDATLQARLRALLKVEALTEGLQASDQRLMRAIAPKTLTEWYSTMTRIKGTSSLPTPSEPFQGVSNTSAFHRDTGTPSRGRNYNPFSPNNYPRYPSGARRPPSPCKYCQGDHWNNECSMNRRPYRQQAYHGQPTAHYFPPEQNGAHNLPVPAPRSSRTPQGNENSSFRP